MGYTDFIVCNLMENSIGLIWVKIKVALMLLGHFSRDIRFPTIRYVGSAKAQTSLHMGAV